MEQELIEIQVNERMPFSCGPSVSCFTECCHDLDQVLTPYDVLRLKTHLHLSSSEFLSRYTIRFTGPETGLPLVGLRPIPEKRFACSFLAEEGCTVYADRPSSCRSYPLIRMASRSRQTGEITVRYAMFREPHCRGWESSEKQGSVAEWLENQGLEPYNTWNDKMLELIAAVNRLKPKTLSSIERDDIYTALYDTDTFLEQRIATGQHVSIGSTPTPESVLDLGLQWALERIKRLA